MFLLGLSVAEIVNESDDKSLRIFRKYVPKYICTENVLQQFYSQINDGKHETISSNNLVTHFDMDIYAGREIKYFPVSAQIPLQIF